MTRVVTFFHVEETTDEALLDWWGSVLDGAYDLWMESLGDRWPLDRDVFRRYAEEGTVIREGAQTLGLVLHERTPERGSIKAIVVRPDVRRQGIGTMLLRHAVRRLRRQGHGTHVLSPAPSYLKLGGGHRYLWPGIPEDLSDSRPFFDRVLRWPSSEPSYDMIMPLDQFLPPPDCYARSDAAGVTFRTASAADMPAVLAFEEGGFPGWSRYFREHAPEDIVIGVDAEEQVVAALVLDMPPIVWSRLVGERTAEIGAVGVGRSHRNLGLGTALVARSCEILRERGVEVALLRWLYRVHFYSHVGFRIWKRYETSSRTFG
jgi:ribosomal protein S18 acetylase RimI-like enzyme